MPNRKVIDIYVGVRENKLTDSNGFATTANILDQEPLRGDQVLQRWHLFEAVNGTTAYVLPEGGEFEFVCSTAKNANSTTRRVYSDDADFNPADWADFSKGSGKICCRVDYDKKKLTSDLGTTLVSGTYFAELVMTPPPISEGQHVTLWQGEIVIRNDLYRTGTRATGIVVKPPSQQSSSSSCSSTSTQSSSSSTIAGFTTSSSATSSQSSTSVSCSSLSSSCSSDSCSSVVIHTTSSVNSSCSTSTSVSSCSSPSCSSST